MSDGSIRWLPNTVSAVMIVVALALGSTIGTLVGIEIGERRNQDIRECILDVLIEPPPTAAPEDRYDVWSVDRLVAECKVTVDAAEVIRD